MDPLHFLNMLLTDSRRVSYKLWTAPGLVPMPFLCSQIQLIVTRQEVAKLFPRMKERPERRPASALLSVKPCWWRITMFTALSALQLATVNIPGNHFFSKHKNLVLINAPFTLNAFNLFSAQCEGLISPF